MFNPFKIIAQYIRRRIPVDVRSDGSVSTLYVGSASVSLIDEPSMRGVSVATTIRGTVLLLRADDRHIDIGWGRDAGNYYGNAIAITSLHLDPPDFTMFTEPKRWDVGPLSLLYRSGAAERSGLENFRIRHDREKSAAAA